MGTNGYQVEDVLNLLGTGSGSCNLTTGLVASSTCGTGDWPYNFLTYPTNAVGGHMYHSLQTLTGSTPLYCNPATGTQPGITGPLGPLPAGTNCTAGFPGLLPFLGTIANVGIGSLNQKIIVDNLELYVNAPNTNPNAVTGGCPGCPGTIAWPFSDILGALDLNYSGTSGAQTEYLSAPAGCTSPGAGCVKPALNYDSVFAQYLGIGSSLGGTASVGLTVFGGTTTPRGGPPNYLSRTDTNVAKYPAVLNSLGGLVGVNQTTTDDLGNGNIVVRLTDSVLDPSQPNDSFITENSGNADINIDSPLFTSAGAQHSIVCLNDINDNSYPLDINHSTFHGERLYASTHTSTNGLVTGAGTCTMGHAGHAGVQAFYVSGSKLDSYTFTDWT